MKIFRRGLISFGIFLLLQTPAATGQALLLKISPDLLKASASATESGKTLPVWVFFTDKGDSERTSLQSALAEARRSLRPRSLQRRAKVRGESNLVDYEDLPLSLAYMDQVRALVPRIRTVCRWLNAVSVEISPDQLGTLAALGFVAGLDVVRGFRRNEGDNLLSPEEGPTVTSRSPIYGPSLAQLSQIGIPALHHRGLSGRGVLVALLDVGFHKSHEIFRLANLVAEWDFVFGDGDVQQNPSDPNDYSDAHGTATWSLLGGFKYGQLIGPAFGADFLLAKTEDERSETPIEEDYWAAGIEWAESFGADVVSSSLGYTDWYQFKDMDGKTAVTTKAANRATSLGVVVVNAAGNERGNAWGHIIAPADGFDVIAVGAVDASGKVASFSSPGPTFDGRIKPEVCAQGVNDWIAQNRKDGSDFYTSGAGTSYATPLVAGTAALLLEAHPDWTEKQVRAALMSTGGNAASPNNDYGWGIVNGPAAADTATKAPVKNR